MTECRSARQPFNEERRQSRKRQLEHRLTYDGSRTTKTQLTSLDYSHDAYQNGVSYGTKRSEFPTSDDALASEKILDVCGYSAG